MQITIDTASESSESLRRLADFLYSLSGEEVKKEITEPVVSSDDMPVVSPEVSDAKPVSSSDDEFFKMIPY